MKSKVPLLLVIAVSCLAVAACPRPSAECRAFYVLSPAGRASSIRAAPVEKQLDLYLCGVYQHPPTNYASVVAESGERIVPALLARIASAGRADSCVKAHVLPIFGELAERGQLRGRRDVLEQLRAVPAGIAFEECRGEAQEHLKRIEAAYASAP